MRLKGILVLLVAALAIAADFAHAAPILDDVGKNGPRFLGGFVIANEITIGAASVPINSLGVWDQAGDGLAVSHEVGVWDATGGLVASATVPAGTAGTLEDAFRYVALPSSITLLAGQKYHIGALYPDALDPFNDPWDPDGDGNPANSPAVGDGVAVAAGGAGLVINGDYFAASGTLTNPTSFGGGTPGRWGAANARFFVPEPTSLALAAWLGLAAQQMRHRRRMRL
jgi:hypothetical protein